MAGIHAARRDQTVVVGHQIEQLHVVQAIGFKCLRVDYNLEQVFPVSANLDLQHFGNAFDFLLQPACNKYQLAL